MKAPSASGSQKTPPSASGTEKPRFGIRIAVGPVAPLALRAKISPSSAISSLVRRTRVSSGLWRNITRPGNSRSASAQGRR